MVNYGLDAELAAKAAEKYDHELEHQVTEWIEQVTGESKGPLTFAEWLNDGMVLCKLVNSIKPGTIKRVNKMKAPFKKMENITSFTDAARALGVNESSMFATPDLFEEKNLGSVCNCLYTFASVVQTSVPEYSGPKLGIAIAGEAHSREKKAVTQTGGLAGTMANVSAGTSNRDVAPAAVPSGAQAGKAAGRMAAEGGQMAKTPSDGAAKRVAPPPARGGAPRAGGAGHSGGHGGGGHGGGHAAQPSEFVGYGGSAEADAQGLDADMKRHMEEKFDHGLEAEVCHWIEAVTGKSKGPFTTAEWLKDGQVLCALGNAIQPGSIKGVSTAKAPFTQMENIKKFLTMARGVGMAESSVFSTPDLYEEKNMGIVINALNAFGGVVQTKVPSFKGPYVGVAQKAEVKDESRGLGLITNQQEAFSGAMQVERPKDSHMLTMGARSAAQ